MCEWIDIPNYYGTYKVSSNGEIESSKNKKRISKFLDKKSNRYKVALTHPHFGRKVYFVGNLVALSFLYPFEAKCTILYKDGDTTNDCLENLNCIIKSEKIKIKEVRSLSLDSDSFYSSGWMDVPNYEGLYFVNRIGDVYSVLSGKTLSKCKDSNGYISYILSKDGVKKCLKAHTIVANAFLPKDDSRVWINHKDGNKENNDLSNLERCTPGENISHAFKIGLNKGNRNPKNIVRVV